MRRLRPLPPAGVPPHAPVSTREYPLTDGVASVRAHFHPPGLASSPTGSAVVFDEYLRVLTVSAVAKSFGAAQRTGKASVWGFGLGFWSRGSI